MEEPGRMQKKETHVGLSIDEHLVDVVRKVNRDAVRPIRHLLLDLLQTLIGK